MADITPPEINTTALYLLFGRLEKMCENGFDGVHSRLDKLNGRVGSTEQDVAVLKDRASHMETRADDAKDTADAARGSAKWWSVGIAGTIAGAFEILRTFYLPK